MGDRRCCCGECFIFQDAFERDDSTDVGDDWVEVSGDWAIVSNKLNEPGASSALIMCNKAVPTRSAGEMQVGVTVYNAQVGDIFYIYLCCTDNHTSNGIEIKYEKISSSSWTVTIAGSGGDGTTTQTADQWGGDPNAVRLVACTDDVAGHTKAYVVSSTHGPAWIASSTSVGRYCGLGHTNITNGATFDDFVIEEIRTPTLQCADCWCWCLNKPPGRHLVASIYLPTNRASCLTDFHWDMDWDWDAGGPNVSWWTGTAPFPRESGTQDIPFILECNAEDDDDESHPGKNFVLYWDLNVCCNDNPGGCAAKHIPSESSLCDPLNLVFGPFKIRCDDLTCFMCIDAGEPNTGPPMYPCDESDPDVEGEYYIVISE